MLVSLACLVFSNHSKRHFRLATESSPAAPAPAPAEVAAPAPAEVAAPAPAPSYGGFGF